RDGDGEVLPEADEVHELQIDHHRFLVGGESQDVLTLRHLSLPVFSERRLAALAGADANDLVHGSDEYFTVANAPRLGCALDGFDLLHSGSPGREAGRTVLAAAPRRNGRSTRSTAAARSVASLEDGSGRAAVGYSARRGVRGRAHRAPFPPAQARGRARPVRC